MPSFLADTSCIIAALSGWHEHHDVASKEIEERLERGEDHVVAGPVLVESYSVLTRIPQPNRLSPSDAARLLLANLAMPNVKTVALDASAYSRVIQVAPEQNVAGGRIYDRIILECALAARVDALLTFNDRHFRGLVDGGVQIVVPR